MICKFCGREVADDVIFCNYCGRRMDDKKLCPSCGAEMPYDGIYCGVCGTRVEPEKTAVQGEAAVAAVADGEASALPAGFQKILDYIKCGLAGAAALFGFVFTFLIGVDVKAVGGEIQVVSLYDYFGKAYENLDKLVGLKAAEKAANYIPNVFGTLIAAGALILAVTFAAIVLTRCIRNFSKGGVKVDYSKSAISCYLAYAVFATLFLALHAASVTATNNYVTVTADTGFNAATTAGLALGGVCCGGYFVCGIIERIKDFKNAGKIAKECLALFAGVLAVVLVVLLANPVIGYNQGTSGGISSGHLAFGNLVIYSLSASQQTTVILCNTLGFAAQLTAVILAVAVIGECAKSLSGGHAKVLSYSIPCVLLSAANLATAVIATQEVEKTLTTEVSWGYGMPIAVLVMSVILLVVSSVFTVIASKYEN